jgi:hypothetical protein
MLKVTVTGAAIGYRPGHDTASWTVPPLRLAAVGLLAAALAACGGGGGDGTASPQQSHDVPTGDDGSGGGSGTVTVVPTGAEAGAFLFSPKLAVASEDGLAAATGGALFASWDPADAANSMRPGMKVTFFGAAQGCSGARNGAVGEGDAGRFDANATLTGVTTTDGSAMRWTPLGSGLGCGADAQAASGDSLVHLHAGDGDGAVGMLTYTGTRADGSSAFFGAFGAGGQNGAGANANIAGSFVAFRQGWSGSAPLRPWAANGSARVYTVQSVASTAGATGAAGAQAVQAKQEILASFINPDCVAQMAGAHPCQLQYAVSTAIFRTGVTNWDTVGWFNAGKVWFDAAQGGTPVVDGPIKASGSDTTDGASSLSLYTSHGAATQHAVFANQAFDVTISFPQLVNAMKLTTARALSVEASALTDAQMAAFWGTTWHQPGAWATLSGSVGQEVYNPFADHAAHVGGSFKSFYIGPAA